MRSLYAVIDLPKKMALAEGANVVREEPLQEHLEPLMLEPWQQKCLMPLQQGPAVTKWLDATVARLAVAE
ncbi:hypothetical protein NDU88_005293 [Pleurodeles waltl]|uniref:Uncharacterized protein n=1 Tax=Pleurodeles waltl TaxID=8319 RepID=A0AAV7WUB7_PLEWA|nr:hypothetical protein NDU88_005293 [Pleurodeles waltl]